jgi:hypothetical protein
MQETAKKLYQLRGQLKDLQVSDAHAVLAERLIREAVAVLGVLRDDKQLEPVTVQKLTTELQYEITRYLRGEYVSAGSRAARTAAFNRAKENAVRWLTRALDQLPPA